MSKGTDPIDALLQHERLDNERFGKIYSKLSSVEKAVYGIYVAMALFAFLIAYPNVIRNLTMDAQAQIGERK